MTNLIDGKKVAGEVAQSLATQVRTLKAKGITPKLVILCIKPDSRSGAYMRAKVIRAKEVGVLVEIQDLEQKSLSDIKDHITNLNQDPLVHGIILQLPIPEEFNKQAILDCIDPLKDVDGLTSTNQQRLEQNEPGLVPATPQGVLALLSAYNVKFAGKTACVIGRSNLVGKPTALLLKQAGAKVLVVHKGTDDVAALTKQADILVSAAGQPRLVTADMVRDGAVVIDVGITEENQRLHGDVDFVNVSQKASLITPVPGGVGPMTVIMLLSNVVKVASAKN